MSCVASEAEVLHIEIVLSFSERIKSGPIEFQKQSWRYAFEYQEKPICGSDAVNALIFNENLQKFLFFIKYGNPFPFS